MSIFQGDYGHHSRGGFCFKREDNGDVHVRLIDWTPPPEAGQPQLVREVVLPENEWASLVAFVSEPGESPARWQAARDFHAGSDR